LEFGANTGFDAAKSALVYLEQKEIIQDRPFRQNAPIFNGFWRPAKIVCLTGESI
jgi:hypothetical protein